MMSIDKRRAMRIVGVLVGGPLDGADVDMPADRHGPLVQVRVPIVTEGCACHAGHPFGTCSSVDVAVYRLRTELYLGAYWPVQDAPARLTYDYVVP